MSNSLYCLDTSGFFDGYIRYYPPDIFSTLWDNMDHLCGVSRLLIPEEVYREIEYHHDEAFTWVEARKEATLVPTDAGLALRVRVILKDYPRLIMRGSTRNRADPFVIATAELRSAIVITGERGGSEQNPKIPYVCKQRNIRWATFLELLRLEGWSF